MSASPWLDFALLVVLAVLLYGSARLRRERGAPAVAAHLARARGFWPRSRFDLVARQAGFDPGGLRWPFWAAKIVLAMAVPLLVLELLQRIGLRLPLAGIVAFGLIGFLAPDVWLRLRRRSRQSKVRRELSFFLDLLVALLKAGLNLEEGFRRAGRDGLDPSHPLASEVEVAARMLDAGADRGSAFKSLADGVGIAELRAVASALKLAARHGTSAEAALESQADLLRMKERELVRRRVTVAATKAVFPLFLCGFPVFLVIVLFPAILELVETFRALADLL